MSKKDGKSVLLGAKEKKGFWSVSVAAHELEANQQAVAACPTNVIQIR